MQSLTDRHTLKQRNSADLKKLEDLLIERGNTDFAKARIQIVLFKIYRSYLFSIFVVVFEKKWH